MTILKHILDAAPTLAELYAVPLMNVVLNQLRSSDAEEIVLLGFDISRQLAKYAGTALRPRAMDFVHSICSALRDQTSHAKRRAAVVALTDIVAGTACMIELAQSNEDFVDLLIGHLATEHDQKAKREVVRALGSIGAMKPTTSVLNVADKLVQEITDAPEAASSADRLDSGLIPLDPDVMHIKIPLYIADWVLGQLMEIWQEPSLKIHHHAVSNTNVWLFISPEERDCRTCTGTR